MSCRSMTGAILNSCSDGIGHSLWLRGEGLPFAISVCENFEERERGRCTSGVVMQMLRPNAFTKAKPVIDENTPPSAWVAVCREVESLTKDPEMQRSCWYEMGQAAMIPVDLLLSKMGPRMKEMRPADVAALNKAWAAGMAQCAVFGERAEDCRQRIAESVSWRVADNPGWMAATCPALGEKWGKYCLSTHSILRPDER